MPRQKDIFLVAHYIRTPKEKGKTIHKGYINNDENVSYNESVTLSRGLKDRDLTAAIILNLTQKTVHKCRFDDANDWEKLAAYYAKAYPQYMQLADPPKEEAIDLGEAAQDDPSIIQDEIDNEILEDIKKVAEEEKDEQA